jgi:hypothetical protein
VTATADRFRPGRSREELRLVELASGLLLQLDAYRLTGRLPLEVQVQVQASRLRHAVKLAVQAEATRTAALPPVPPPSAAMEPAGAALDRHPALGPARPGGLGVPAVLPRPDHRPARSPAGQRRPGSVRRPLLGEAREFRITGGCLAGRWR